MAFRMIISGGGTGGHIFPAIAIADAVKSLRPDTEILFVGAEGKMEMERVPKAGYQIVGLPVVGFQRKLTLKNLAFPFKLMKSLRLAKKVVKDFRPDVAVGVGGYASGPVLQMATKHGVPALIQEQNSYAGVTNRILAKKVNKICVAYDHVKRFFPADKIVLTGNPVREDIVAVASMDQQKLREEACVYYGFTASRKILFITGGSLGARTLNEAVIQHLSEINASGVQVLWQTGKYYIDTFGEQVKGMPMIKATAFVDRMDWAYAMADLVVARAGALTLSELCVLGKPSVLVPSPNVAEDHQTANARELVEKGAAVMVKDAEAVEVLVPKALSLLSDTTALSSLANNARGLGIPDAAVRIAKEIISLIK